jgi:phage terminase large subunit
LKLNIEISRKVADVFAPDVRYRCLWGGRAGQKSYGFADKALEHMCARRTDIAVCREYEATIKDSVHKLVKERIDHYKLNRCFKITNNEILYPPNGSKIIYKHLHDNVDEVKGLEGTDICWIFEGHSLLKKSWDLLDPTIRRTPRMTRDPEIWIEFNPDFEDDFAYQEFVVKTGRDRIAVYTTYLDNPWRPEETIQKAERCKRENEDEYNHIWLGYPRNVGGLVYPQFSMDHHIRDVDLNRIEHVANFFMGQDPHTVYYPACVWVGRMPRGDGTFDYYIYNEWPMLNTFGGKYYHELRTEKKCTLTLKQRAQIYRLLDNTFDRTYYGVTIAARGIDTRFAKGAGAPSTTSNTKGIIIEMADVRNGGMTFETPPEYMIDSQRDRIRGFLDWDRLIPLNAFNEPKMYVMSHCKNMIDTLRFHRFDKDGKEKEDPKRKDFSDALKICMAIEQQYQHVNRLVKKEELIPESVDRIAELKEMYLGG